VKDSLPLEWAPADGADYYDVHRDGDRMAAAAIPCGHCRSDRTAAET